MLNPDHTDEISPEETKRLAKRGEIRLIDCREENEHAYCRIEGSELIPLSNFGALALDALGDDYKQNIVIYCHHGVRSIQAVHYLRQRGYRNSFSMTGGIEEWSESVDTRIPKY